MKSDLYLVDTSVWIDYLKAGTDLVDDRLDELLALNQIACTGMVRLELLAGVRTEAEWRLVDEALSGTIWLRVEDETWTEAARLGYELRRKGKTVPSTDLLIAATARRSSATVLHKDRHYDVLAEELGLPVESYVT